MMPTRKNNVFEIDLGAVMRCAMQIRERIGPETRFFATVKSDAYGYGVVPVAKTALMAGADALSLVSVDDAILLREAGIDAPVLLYAGAVPDREFVQLVEHYNFMPSLYGEASYQAFAAHATRRTRVAVKIEVGPERIGVPVGQAVEFVRKVSRHPLLEVELLNAHANVRGGPRAAESLQWQFDSFAGVVRKLGLRGIDVPYAAIASSKVLRMTGSAMVLNAADPGAAMFAALDPDARGASLQPFHALKSRLIEARDVTRTEFLDEAPFTIVPGMRVGIVAIGYSDGVHRLNCGAVLVGGQRAPLLSPPALEYMRIDLTGIPSAKIGDEVVIVGTQDGQAITPEEVMQAQGAARVADLALEVRPTIARRYVVTE